MVSIPPEVQYPGLQQQGRWRFRSLIGCAVIGVLILGAGYFLHRTNHLIQNAYAAWWVGDLVVEHLKNNDNHWPRNWDDLRDEYEAGVMRSGQPFSFDELSSRIKIDWDANPAEFLARSAGHEDAQFRVIFLADGTECHVDSHEPNQVVLEYLRSNLSDR